MSYAELEVNSEVSSYAMMTDAELRRELLRLGTDVGPFETRYERGAYIKRLIKLKKEEAEGTVSTIHRQSHYN